MLGRELIGAYFYIYVIILNIEDDIIICSRLHKGKWEAIGRVALEASILVIYDEMLSVIETNEAFRGLIDQPLTDPTIAHELMEGIEVPG